MATKQEIKKRQCLLFYLGYYIGDVDGIWGQLSKTAVKAFKGDFGGFAVNDIVDEDTVKAMQHAVAYGMPAKDVATDNNVGDKVSPTGTFWDEIEFFTREEFRCQCNGKYCNGFPVEPEEKMVRTVDEIRRRLGVPVAIVDAGGSGIRCERHNASIPGAAVNSEHKSGRAADLRSSASPERMKQVAEEVMGNTGGIGLYSWGIHVDTGKYSRWNG
jgi:peptidoglycan hydrolase-like protein with peptidoglycan-binding domain